MQVHQGIEWAADFEELQERVSEKISVPQNEWRSLSRDERARTSIPATVMQSYVRKWLVLRRFRAALRLQYLIVHIQVCVYALAG